MHVHLSRPRSRLTSSASLWGAVLATSLAQALLAGAAHAAPNPRARFDRMIEIAAEPGRPVVGPVAIDWCRGVDTTYATGGALGRMLADMEERGWHWGHVPKVAALLCANPEDPQYQRQAGYFVQGLVNLTGQPAARVLADLRLRVDEQRWGAARDQTCARFAASDEDSEEKRALTTAHREMFGCGRDATPAWWLGRASAIEPVLDRTAEVPAQLLRSYRVLHCLSITGKPEYEAITYGLCGHDLRALDEATLARELADAGYNAYAQVLARQQLARTKLRGAALEARVRALAAREPAYAQLAFAIPDAAWDRFTARWRANAAALARAAAFEARFDGPDRRAARGCSAQLRDDFRAYVRGAKPAGLDAFEAAATDDIGVLLLARLTACEAVDGNAHAAELLYRLGHDARPSRGPRLAVLHALLEALGELREHRPRFPIELTDLPSPASTTMWKDAYALASPGVTAMQRSAGVVKKVTRTDDGVIVEFATESWIEDNWHCQDSNKVWKLDAGRVIYHQTCKKVGKRKVSQTAPTIWVPAAYAGGLARGRFVELDYDLRKHHGRSIGVARAIYTKKDRARLVAAYGVEL